MFIERETYSLSMKCLSPIKFNYISEFVLIWLTFLVPALIPSFILILILTLTGHTFHTITQVMWIRLGGHTLSNIMWLTWIGPQFGQDALWAISCGWSGSSTDLAGCTLQATTCGWRGSGNSWAAVWHHKNSIESDALPQKEHSIEFNDFMIFRCSVHPLA